MSSLFADTHNVVAILEKSDAAEGFEQIIDFLCGSYIHYALTSMEVLDSYYSSIFDQWKFLIHTILQSLSAKRTSWNEFSTTMASAVNCLSKGQKFNFSKYIFDSLNQVGDLSTHTTRFISPSLTQKVIANMRRVGKGFSGVETPLFEGMLAQKLEIVQLKARVKKLEKANKNKSSKLRRLRKVGTSRRVESSDDIEDVFNQGMMIADMDMNEGIEL
nr:hypothetical protein [Tanacetum cinerariifolium]